MTESSVEVSIVMPVYNGAEWLEETLASILAQTFTGQMELSVYNDGSTDCTLSVLDGWHERLSGRGVRVVVGGHTHTPKGTGYGRNEAIKQSSGRYLCFCDADDVMNPDRVELQYKTALKQPSNTLVGSGFTRHPLGSTQRYTQWCNTLTQTQLYTQAFTAFGPTMIQPTWFCSRELFDSVGPFSEDGKGTPEDLLFYYKHLSEGGGLVKVDTPLMMYRYHPDCQSFNIHRQTIWDLRVAMLQDSVLVNWSSFTIWNAGKQGRRLYRSLSPQHRSKVVSFCDVDVRKISQGVYTYQECKTLPKPCVPIVHFSAAQPPFVLCVKLGLTDGVFEDNLASLKLTEGIHYYHFS